MPLISEEEIREHARKQGLTEQWLDAVPNGGDLNADQGDLFVDDGNEASVIDRSKVIGKTVSDERMATFCDYLSGLPEEETDGLYVWHNEGPPSLLIVDLMDWYEGDEEALNSAAAKAVGDEARVVWQNEGGEPAKAAGWEQLFPPPEGSPRKSKAIGNGVPDQSNVIAVDLNGTLATGRGPDPKAWGLPTYGAVEAMRHLHGRGYRLFVNSVVGDVAAIDGWLTEHGLRDYFEGINVSPVQPDGANPGKQNAAAYVDDRAVPFRGNWRETVGDLFLCDALTKSAGRRLRVKGLPGPGCGADCDCGPCVESKGRGEPCKQGESAARSGCVPRGRPAGGKKPDGGGKGPKPTTAEVSARVQELRGQEPTKETVTELKGLLTGMTVKDLKGLRDANRFKISQTLKAKLVESLTRSLLGGKQSGSTTPKPTAATSATPLPAATVKVGKLTVEHAAGTTAAFRAATDRALKSIPAHVLDVFASSGGKVVTGKLLTDAVPSLKGVTPRGWPPGHTWDEAEGCHIPGEDGSTGTVVTAQAKSAGGKTADSARTAGVLRHETGHGVDRALGNFSGGPEFKAAYATDVAGLKKGQGLDYFLQEPPGGPQEAFAEVFGGLYGGGASPRNVVKSFPKVAALLRKTLGDKGLKPAPKKPPPAEDDGVDVGDLKF